MTKQTFDLWLETEESATADDDYCNIQVTLAGRVYALNVWTYDFTRREVHRCHRANAPYLAAPDLIVAKLDRATVERAIRELIKNGEVDEAWSSNGNDQRGHSTF